MAETISEGERKALYDAACKKVLSEKGNDFYPGYPLLKRGIYYCSRMISGQYGTVFVKSDYGKIKKVCPMNSMWKLLQNLRREWLICATLVLASKDRELKRGR